MLCAFKIVPPRNKDWYMKQVGKCIIASRVNRKLACCSLLSGGNCGETVFKSVSSAEMSLKTYIARYCWQLQRRNQFCPIKQKAKKSFVYLLCFQPSEYIIFQKCVWERERISTASPPSQNIKKTFINIVRERRQRCCHHLYSPKEVSDVFNIPNLSCMEMKDLSLRCMWSVNIFAY